MVGLVRSTRYVLALASPAPPAPLPRSGFVQRPILSHHLYTESDWLTVGVLSASRVKERTLSTPYAVALLCFGKKCNKNSA